MNWNKGFLRVWIVVSLIWVGFVGAFAFAHYPASDLSDAVSDAAVELALRAKIARNVQKMRSQNAPQSDVDDYLRSESRLWSQIETAGRDMAGIVASRRADWLKKEGMPFFTLGISLPIMLLGLGLIIRWVIKGFKHKET